MRLNCTSLQPCDATRFQGTAANYARWKNHLTTLLQSHTSPTYDLVAEKSIYHQKCNTNWEIMISLHCTLNSASTYWLMLMYPGLNIWISKYWAAIQGAVKDYTTVSVSHISSIITDIFHVCNVWHPPYMITLVIDYACFDLVMNGSVVLWLNVFAISLRSCDY